MQTAYRRIRFGNAASHNLADPRLRQWWPQSPCGVIEECAGPILQRANGTGILSVAHAHPAPRIVSLYQQGCAKILLPRNHVDTAMEAVLLNTSGGLTGGDRLDWSISVGADARLRVATQAAERIYRAEHDEARVETKLRVGSGGTLEWLPQETIMFDGGRLSRTLDVELADTAALLAVESVVLGRQAHGEHIRSGALVDRWHVRRAGRLIFADTTRLTGDPAENLAGPGSGAGAAAFATVLLIAWDMPIAALRALLPTGRGVRAGASALPEAMIVRIVATDGDTLRPALAALLVAIRAAPLPRVWQG